MHRTLTLLWVIFFLISILIISKPASADVGTENTWATKAPMHQARGLLGVAVVDGKIYAIGGSNATSAPQTDSIVSTNEEYNPATDTWVFKAPMPEPMWNFAIAAYGSKIYCIGNGVNQAYDSRTDTWENKAPMPPNKGGLQANTIGDKIYLIGGQDNEAYDPQTDTWTARASLPIAVGSCASAAFDGKLYVFGGGNAYLNQTWGKITQIYNPQTDTWSFGSSSLFITNFAQAGITTGINAPLGIYLFDAGLPPNSSAQVYDPLSDTWKVGVVQPTSRTWFSLAVVDDSIYAIGGLNSFEDQFVTNKITFTPFALNEVFTPFGYGTVHYTPTPTSVTAQPSPTQQTAMWSINQTTVLAVAVVAVVVVGLVVYFRRFRERIL